MEKRGGELRRGGAGRYPHSALTPYAFGSHVVGES
jgi:hypothetical protein